MLRVFQPAGFLIFLLMSGCNQTLQPSLEGAMKEDQILKTYLHNGAWNYHYLTKDFEQWVDRGLAQDSSIAYLWQQKALPYWKQHKYDLAYKYYEKAIALDPEVWLSRFGYLQCIFAKRYSEALETLNRYTTMYGNTYEQDHDLIFFKALCHLQLEQYKEAETLLKKDIAIQEANHGPEWVHYLSHYYLGVAYYEQNTYALAIHSFENALKDYPQFSDAYYHLSRCYQEINDWELAQKSGHLGQSYYLQDYTFNEDASLYVLFPYQITWEWDALIAELK